jgi:hypothetical protein
MKIRSLVTLTALVVAALSSTVARADSIDPAALAVARQLLDVMHASSLGDQMVQQMMASMGAGLEAANPGKNAEVEKLLSEVVVPEINQVKPDILDATANIYAANFTAGELKQMLAYYQSDIGRKMIERMPTLLKEQGEVSRAIVGKMVPDMIAKLQAAIAAHGLNQPHKM